MTDDGKQEADVEQVIDSFVEFRSFMIFVLYFCFHSMSFCDRWWLTLASNSSLSVSEVHLSSLTMILILAECRIVCMTLQINNVIVNSSPWKCVTEKHLLIDFSVYFKYVLIISKWNDLMFDQNVTYTTQTWDN